MTNSIKTARSIDWLTLVLYLSLVAIGSLMIYAAEYQVSETGEYVFSWSSAVGRQFIWTGIALIAFIITFLFDSKFWNTFAYPIYFLTTFALFLVLIFGEEIKGSKSWFIIFGFSFQPAEFAKLGTALAISAYLSYHKTSLKVRKHILLSCLIFLTPSALILLQPDAGSALVFFSFFIVMFREGLNPYFYLLLFFLAALFIGSLLLPITSILLILTCIANAFLLNLYKTKPQALTFFYIALLIVSVIALFIGINKELLVANSLLLVALAGIQLRTGRFRPLFLLLPMLLVFSGLAYSSQYVFENVLEPHQQNRINDWLRPSLSDPQGTIYNVRQSTLAIESGGFKGKGFLQGTYTKLNYVPEQSDDFIFSTIGEEQGFLGAFGIIVIFVLLMLRLTILAERSRLPFGRIFAYGVAGILFFHFFVNIGMSMGLVPVIGIPLPFISKGGTSLLAFSILIAIILKQDSKRYSL